MNTLKVSECGDGYRYQGPRFIKLGPDSGEEFRNVYLIPWLEENKANSNLCVDFDGTVLFTPSFLEECFGGAIRKGFEVVRKLKFSNMPEEELKKVEGYISKAKAKK